MKTSTIVMIVIGSVVVLGGAYFIFSKKAVLVPRPNPAGAQSTAQSLGQFIGSGIAAFSKGDGKKNMGGGLFGNLFGGGSGTSASGVSGSSAMQPGSGTGASNYIADSTAASDDESGVVGFGGWGD